MKHPRRTRRTCTLLPLLLVASALGGCPTQGFAPDSGTKLLLVQIDAPPSFTADQINAITSTEVVIRQANPQDPYPFADARGIFDVDGVLVSVGARETGGRRELVITFGTNPFQGRRAELFVYPQQLAPSADGGGTVTPPLEIRARAFTKDFQGRDVLLAESAPATQDVQGGPLQLGDADRTVNLLLQCVAGAPCDTTVRIPPGTANITVGRLPHCPTENFGGKLFVFVLSNPLATPASSSAQANAVVDLSDPATTRSFTIEKLSPGLQFLLAVLDVSGQLASANYVPRRGDLHASLQAIDVPANGAAQATILLDQVVGVGPCSTSSGTARATVTRLPLCGTTSFEGDLYVFLNRSPIGGSTPASSSTATSVSFADPGASQTLTLPPVPPGPYWATAVLDVGRDLAATGFNPAPGDLISATVPVEITTNPEGTFVSLVLEEIVGGVPCRPGVDVNLRVVSQSGEPFTRALVLVRSRTSGTNAVDVVDALGNASFTSVLVPYDLTVMPPGIGFDGIASWMNVARAAATARAPIDVGQRGFSRSITYTVTYPCDQLFGQREGEIMVVTPFNRVNRHSFVLLGTGNDTIANQTLFWDGPETIDIVIAGAQYSRSLASGLRIAFLDFGAVKLRVTSGTTVTFSMPAAARRQAGNPDRLLPVTVSNSASFNRAVIFPMVDFDGFRFPLPGSPPGGQGTGPLVGPINVMQDGACPPPCSQYMAIRGEIDASGNDTCKSGGIARPAIAAADTGVTVTLPLPPTITSPVASPPGTPAMPVPQPLAYDFVPPAGFLAHRVSLSREDDIRLSHMLLTTEAAGTFPDLSLLAERLPATGYDFSIVSYTSASFGPATSLEAGRGFPQSELSPSTFAGCTTLPALEPASGVSTAFIRIPVEVLP
jgi:hypothetical protein